MTTNKAWSIRIQKRTSVELPTAMRSTASMRSAVEGRPAVVAAPRTAAFDPNPKCCRFATDVRSQGGRVMQTRLCRTIPGFNSAMLRSEY